MSKKSAAPSDPWLRLKDFPYELQYNCEAQNIQQTLIGDKSE